MGSKLAALRNLLGSEEKEMPFLEHLEELRRVLLRIVGLLLLSTIAAYIFSGRVLDTIVKQTIEHATFLKPLEAFNARLKVAFILGLLASLPVVLWQIWGFVVPGLLRRERRIVGPLVLWSAILFYGGVAFSYLVLTPTMLGLLVGFGTELVRPQISVGALLDFVVSMAMACGLLFQLPLVVAVLSLIGVLSPTFLMRRWRHAVVAIFVITAAVTPGDGPSQIILAAPVLVLYFASILVARAIWKGKSAEAAAPAAGAEGGSHLGG